LGVGVGEIMEGFVEQGEGSRSSHFNAKGAKDAREAQTPERDRIFQWNKDRVPVLNREYCNGCGWCVGHCKPNAIKCIHAETGDVVWDGFGMISDWVPN